MSVGTGSGENGVENVGLSREEVGADSPGQNVECEGASFSRAGAIEIDDPQEALDNK